MKSTNKFKNSSKIQILLALAIPLILPIQRATAYTPFLIYEFDPSYTPTGSLVITNGSTLYGVTTMGGTNDNGMIFSVDTNGGGFTDLHSFRTSPGSSDGCQPLAGLIMSPTGKLYGTTSTSGDGGFGTVFEMSTNGNGYTVLHSFSNGGTPANDGGIPDGALILSGETLYGTTLAGGAGTEGTVYEVNTNGAYETLYSFISDTDSGIQPQSRLLLANGVLYGTASSGGTGNSGTVFAFTLSTSHFTVLRTLTNATDGSIPIGGLALSSNTLFGTTSWGGPNGEYYGTVFAVGTNGSGFSVIHAFGGTSDPGWRPMGDLLTFAGGEVLIGVTYGYGEDEYGTVFQMSTNGSGYETIFEEGDSSLEKSPGLNGILLTGTGSGRVVYVTATGSTSGSGGSGQLFGLTALQQ